MKPLRVSMVTMVTISCTCENAGGGGKTDVGHKNRYFVSKILFFDEDLTDEANQEHKLPNMHLLLHVCSAVSPDDPTSPDLL